MEIEKLYVTLALNASKFASGIRGAVGNARNAASQIGAALKTAGTVGLGALTAIAGGAVALGSKLIGLGSDAQETGSLIQTSLGKATAGFNQRLRDFAGDANRSFYELQQGSSTIVAMTKAMGAGERGAADFGVTFAQMASDLGSFFNRTDEQVFLDLQSALGGSSETLQKYGVDIRETTLKQMALNQGLIASASDILPPLIRAQLIQQAITEQAADAMGDAVRTSDSWANSLRGLRGHIKDAATEAGMKLIPIMTPLLNLAGDLAERGIAFLSDKFEKLLPHLTEAGQFISNLVAGIQSGMSPLEAFNYAWGTLGHHLGLNSETIKAVREAVGKLVTAVMDFMEPITQWIQQNIELKDVLIGLGIVLGGVVLSAIISIAAALAPIVLTVGGVIAVVALLRQAWETDFAGIRDFAAGIWQAIQSAWAAFKALFSGDWDGFLSNIKAAWQVGWNAVVTFLGNLWSMVQPKLAEWFAAVQAWFKSVDWKGLAQTVIDFLVEKLSQLWAYILPKFTEWHNSITAWFQSIDWGKLGYDLTTKILEKVVEWFRFKEKFESELWEKAKEWFSSIDWGSLGRTILDGIVAALKASSAVKDALLDMVKGAWDAIVDFIQPGSPSKLAIKLFSTVPEGAVASIERGRAAVEAAALGLAQAVGDPIAAAISNVAGTVSGNGGGGRNVNYAANTTIYTNQPAMQVVRASRHLDKLGAVVGV